MVTAVDDKNMDKKIQFILIDTGSESNQINMSDVRKMDNGIQISETHKHVNKIVDLLIRIHFSYIINTRVRLPGKHIWSKVCVLNDLIADNGKEYYILVVNNAIHRLSTRYLNTLEKKDNIHIYSLLLDSFEKMPLNVRKMIHVTKFERIYSFQKSDCKKYGFHFTNQIYSKADLSKYKSLNEESDVYYIGAEKGRIDEIYSIFTFLTNNGITCDFNVVVDKIRKRHFEQMYPGIKYITKRISYSEILGKIAKTKCILELCQQGQDGFTMRFYEALFYNKLLITNNKETALNKYFDDRYIQIIKDDSTIDIDKIKQTQSVNYNYLDDFSPIYLLQKLPVSLDKEIVK